MREVGRRLYKCIGPTGVYCVPLPHQCLSANSLECFHLMTPQGDLTTQCSIRQPDNGLT